MLNRLCDYGAVDKDELSMRCRSHCIDEALENGYCQAHQPLTFKEKTEILDRLSKTTIKDWLGDSLYQKLLLTVNEDRACLVSWHDMYDRAWDAVSQIRETIETLSKPGTVQEDERCVDITDEGQALTDAIIKREESYSKAIAFLKNTACSMDTPKGDYSKGEMVHFMGRCCDAKQILIELRQL